MLTAYLGGALILFAGLAYFLWERNFFLAHELEMAEQRAIDAENAASWRQYHQATMDKVLANVPPMPTEGFNPSWN